MTLRLHISALCLAGLAAVSAGAETRTDRTVALVVTTDDGIARAEAVQERLQELGAETLSAVSPNNARLRSIMRRFANEARDARSTFVYIDMPAVRFDDRDYVVPEPALLATGPDRPTDVFTHAIPLQAFARMAAQAEDSGAVVLSVATGVQFPSSLQPLTEAPAAVPGASAIAVASADVGVEQALTRLDMTNARETLLRVTALDGVSVSFIPEPIAEEEPVVVFVEAEPEAEDPVETLEELALLEKSLSRSAKRNIQRGLRRTGHYRGLVDGVIGPQSRDAIMAYQVSRDEPDTGFLTRRQLLDLTTEG